MSVELLTGDCPESKELINQLGGVYPISRDSIIVGYLNGCLAHNPSSNEAHLLLFRSHEQNNFAATLHKMLFTFISFCLWQKEQFIIHGAGIGDKHGGGGFLFLGDSAREKQPLRVLPVWMQCFRMNAPVIGKEDGVYDMYSSPFSQVDMFEERSSDYFRKKVQLRKLLFLNKADELRVLERERHSALTEILTSHVHSFDLMDWDLRIGAFNFCHDLC